MKRFCISFIIILFVSMNISCEKDNRNNNGGTPSQDMPEDLLYTSWQSDDGQTKVHFSYPDALYFPLGFEVHCLEKNIVGFPAMWTGALLCHWDNNYHMYVADSLFMLSGFGHHYYTCKIENGIMTLEDDNGNITRLTKKSSNDTLGYYYFDDGVEDCPYSHFYAGSSYVNITNNHAYAIAFATLGICSYAHTGSQTQTGSYHVGWSRNECAIRLGSRDTIITAKVIDSTHIQMDNMIFKKE